MLPPIMDGDVSVASSGTVAGLRAFLDHAIEKGELPRARATALQNACRRVLDGEQDALALATADIDGLTIRFRNRHRGTARFNDRTIDTYAQRFKAAVDLYLRWLAGDSLATGTHRRTAQPPSRARGAASRHRASQPIADSPRAATGIRIVAINFPVRPGLDATLQIPEDLSPGEAQRLARFIVTLPFAEE